MSSQHLLRTLPRSSQRRCFSLSRFTRGLSYFKDHLGKVSSKICILRSPVRVQGCTVFEEEGDVQALGYIYHLVTMVILPRGNTWSIVRACFHHPAWYSCTLDYAHVGGLTTSYQFFGNVFVKIFIQLLCERIYWTILTMVASHPHTHTYTHTLTQPPPFFSARADKPWNFYIENYCKNLLRRILCSFRCSSGFYSTCCSEAQCTCVQ